MSNLMHVPDRTITLHCQATLGGVCEETFVSSLQIRIYPRHFEFWYSSPNPESCPLEPELVCCSNEWYSPQAVVRAMREHVEPLGSDLREYTSINGIKGFAADLIVTAWMGNAWDIEDERIDPATPEARHTLQEVASLIAMLPNKYLDRVNREIGGLDNIDPRIYEILDDFMAIRELDIEHGLPGVSVVDFRDDSELLDELKERTAAWVDTCTKIAERMEAEWQEFHFDKTGSVYHSMSTNGVDCRFTSCGRGGANVKKDTEAAIEAVLLYLTKDFLRELHSAGFDDLACELRNRAKRQGIEL